MSQQQPPKTNCAKCRRPCEAEAFIALKDGTTFHRFCFTCDLCQQELPLKFALKNGKYYHTECYAEAKANSPKCLKCQNAIISAEISVVVGKDMRFHSRCFICDACQLPLDEHYYQSPQGFLYHESCIACTNCQQSLAGKNYSQLQDGGSICDPCLYNQLRAQDQIASINGSQHLVKPAQQLMQQQQRMQPQPMNGLQNKKPFQQPPSQEQIYEDYNQQQQQQQDYQYANGGYDYQQQQYWQQPQVQQQQYMQQQQQYYQQPGYAYANNPAVNRSTGSLNQVPAANNYYNNNNGQYAKPLPGVPAAMQPMPMNAPISNQKQANYPAAIYPMRK